MAKVHICPQWYLGSPNSSHCHQHLRILDLLICGVCKVVSHYFKVFLFSLAKLCGMGPSSSTNDRPHAPCFRSRSPNHCGCWWKSLYLAVLITVNLESVFCWTVSPWGWQAHTEGISVALASWTVPATHEVLYLPWTDEWITTYSPPGAQAWTLGRGEGWVSQIRRAKLLKSQELTLAKRKFSPRLPYSWGMQKSKRSTEPKTSQGCERSVSAHQENTGSAEIPEDCLGSSCQGRVPTDRIECQKKQDICFWVVGPNGTFHVLLLLFF